MFLEIATFPVLEGKEAAFEMAIETARVELFEKAEGCLSVQLRSGVERPREYVLLVEWATLEDHTERFRNSSALQVFKGLIGDLVAGAADVAHWRSVTP